MAALKPPFRALDMEGLYKKVQKGSIDRIPGKYSSDLMQVIIILYFYDNNVMYVSESIEQT